MRISDWSSDVCSSDLVNTLVPFAALWALMAWSVVAGWGYGWTLLLALPTAGLYVRTFIIQHDCGHGSYFPDQRLNDLVGRCLGLVTLFPYGYWKKTHAVHHGTSGNLDRREMGDIETLTVAEYQSLSRSEEHTSELQSLMRISYAVFCLKKKNKQKTK